MAQMSTGFPEIDKQIKSEQEEEEDGYDVGSILFILFVPYHTCDIKNMT